MSTPPHKLQRGGTFRFQLPSSASTPRSVTPSSDEMSQILSEYDASEPSSFLSPTSQPHVLAPLPHGRRSVIWRYFRKIEDDKGDGAVCIVPKATPSGVCGERKSRNINVIRNHLKKCDPNLFDRVAAEDEENARVKTEKNADKFLKNSLTRKSKKSKVQRKNWPEEAKYNLEYQHQVALDKTLAIFIGASNTPYSVTQNEDFKAMLNTFDPRYRVPGRSRLMSLISGVVAEMKTGIKLALSTSRKINLCADLWSKKGLTTSYLGITAHFYCGVTRKLKSATLAVRILPHPHTGEAICELTNTIISEWGIPLNKVQFIITDNGSNIVKAYKLGEVAAIDMDKETGGDDIEEEEEEALLPEEDALEEEELEDNYTEVVEFLENDEMHREVFRSRGMKRLSCFSHTLQLVVSKFNKDKSAKELLSKVYKIVSSVSKSGKATEALIEATGKKLVSHSVTRWTSAYLVVKRLLEVKESLMLVLIKNNMNTLQPEEWDSLVDVKDLLHSFADLTNIAGGEKYPTLSLVIVYYYELQDHLEKMMERPSVQAVAEIMLKELHIRFKKLLDYNDPDHDSIYLVATLLDPRFKQLLTSQEVEKAKNAFLKYMKTDESDDSDTPPVTPAGDANDDGPPVKRMKYSSIPNVLQRLEKVVTEKKEQVKHRPKVAETQLNAYLDSADVKDLKESNEYFNDDFNLIRYWCASSYKVIAPFALDILCVPCSSAPVERTFSVAGISTSGRRNRLSSSRLENEVLLIKNREYYEN